jgi:hypothetical protein
MSIQRLDAVDQRPSISEGCGCLAREGRDADRVGTMPMTLLKGHYRVVGAFPDGDWIRFYPQDPGMCEEAAGIAVRANSTGGVHCVSGLGRRVRLATCPPGRRVLTNR